MSASQYRIYARLQHAAHMLKKSADRALLDIAQVTTAQAAVMAVIRQNDTATPSQVAETLGLNQSALTAMANRLEKLGYVTRRPSQQDRRRQDLVLSSRGMDVLERIAPAFAEINTQIETAFASLDLSVLAADLERLAHNLKDR